MELINNIQMENFGVDSNILCTTGVSSCVAALVELQDKVFIYHIDPSCFQKSTTGSINHGHSLLIKIFDKICLTDGHASVQKTYLIGGWKNDQYKKLRDQIDSLCSNPSSVMDYKYASSCSFYSFIDSIKLNLITFNLPQKSPDGRVKKDDDDDDDPNDYIMDCTIIFGRSSDNVLVIYQYDGREHERNSDKHRSLLLGTYVINVVSHDIKAYLFDEKQSLLS
ncbi:unnamed protein product [Adineta ricciae]|uniref:Uncharacterized protein n=1 Tax=Adineta ricciae TaxID=249248 RepID=A0A814S3P1_ADIRI|nr:unnamed protein product [Adineta ricciae]